MTAKLDPLPTTGIFALPDAEFKQEIWRYLHLFDRNEKDDGSMFGASLALVYLANRAAELNAKTFTVVAHGVYRDDVEHGDWLVKVKRIGPWMRSTLWIRETWTKFWEGLLIRLGIRKIVFTDLNGISEMINRMERVTELSYSIDWEKRKNKS